MNETIKLSDVTRRNVLTTIPQVTGALELVAGLLEATPSTSHGDKEFQRQLAEDMLAVGQGGKIMEAFSRQQQSNPNTDASVRDSLNHLFRVLDDVEKEIPATASKTQAQTFVKNMVSGTREAAKELFSLVA